MATADCYNQALSGPWGVVMSKTVQPIDRPKCACGGCTHLQRVETHPVYGKGFEVRFFSCEFCGWEATSETNPNIIHVAPEHDDRKAILSVLLGKLRNVGRAAGSRGRSATA
jgi:hypothetical protein